MTSIVITVCRYNLCFNFFLLLKVAFNVLYTKFCLAPFLRFFAFLQFEAGLDKNTLELSNEVLLSETKLHKGIFVPEKDKYIASFFFDDKILKSSLLN